MGSSPTHGTMNGKHDTDIIRLFNENKGGRLIAAELKLNVGYVSRRLKKIGLVSARKNQYRSSYNTLQIVFGNIPRLDQAAEHYFKYVCDMAGFHYAVPPIYEPYDLLVDFGDGWKKVQIKSSTNKSFRLTRSRINSSKTIRVPYTIEEVDFFFLFRSSEQCWLVPFDEIGNKTSTKPEIMFPGFLLKFHWANNVRQTI